MQKIYVSEPATTPEDAAVHIVLKTNGFTAYIKPGNHVIEEENLRARTLDFDPNLIESWPDVMNVTQDQFGNLCFIWASENANNRDGVVAQSTRKRVLDLLRRYSVSVALCEDKTYAVYSNQRCYVEAEPGIAFEVVVAGWRKAEQVFRQHVPAIVPFLNHKDLKMRALGRLRQHDALNALELQTDMLFEVIYCLTNQKTLPEWWTDLYQIVHEHRANSVYPISIPESLGFIKQEKEYVRNVQKKYFEELAATYG